MKKNYSYSIDIEFADNRFKNFINEIIAEVESDEKQLKLTKAINKETFKLHGEIFNDFLDELNKILEPIGVKFDDIRVERNDTMAICTFNNGYSSVMMIEAISERGFEDSKYITYTGKYNLRIGRNGGNCYTAGQKQALVGTIKTVDDVLNYMRDDLKEHIRKNRE